MKFATLADIDDVIRIYRTSWILSHINDSKIRMFVKSKQVICEDGVVITFRKLKRKHEFGNYVATKGVTHLRQIVAENKGNGNTQKVFDKFVKFIKSDIVLLVRSDNKRAISFYKKNQFVKVGKIDWSSLKGIVMKRSYE